MLLKNWLNYLNYRYKIYNIYCYGSLVYGTNNKLSDEDYIIISEYKPDNINHKHLEEFGMDVTFYTPVEFQNLIDEHEISALECLWLSEQYVLKKTMDFTFNLDIEKLRDSISSKSSNSWVKFKKKFIVEKDYQPYIGIKSLFHSLRILNFGIQIAENGKIRDYQSMKQLWQDTVIIYDAIMSMDVENIDRMEYIKEYNQSTYNKLKSEFKKVAPKLK